jgi:putative phosphoesterase
MNVAIIADTHVPDRETELPEPFRERIREADHVVHAGDFTGPETFEEISELADDLTAVHGNMDEDLDLPFYDTVEVDGLTVAVTHTHIGVRTKEDWMRVVADTAAQYAEEPYVGVGGHSHVVEDEEFELFEEAEEVDGPTVRVLNPGSATGADPADEATMMTAEVEDGEFDVTLHEA